MTGKTVTIPDLSGVRNFLVGKKVYITVLVGMAVVAANHYGLLPPEYVPAGLNPADWVQDEFKLALGAFYNATQQRAARDVAEKKAP